MSCPTCSCTTPGTTCDTCGSYVSIENGAVQPVNQAPHVRVSDRNGLPRNLVNVPSSVVSTDAHGNVKNRTGATGNEINLLLLREVAAATKGVITIDGNGNIAILPKNDVDAYLATIGGVVTWTTNMPRSNLLNESELSPYRNKMLTIGCSTDGMVEIGFLDLDEADYIGIDSEGKPIGRQFCDADAADEFESLFGCSGGVMSKINGVAGKKLIINDDGKFVLTDDVGNKPNWLNSKLTICQKTVGYVENPSYPIEDAQIDVPFGGGYSGTYDMTTVPGYTPGSSVAIVRAVADVNVRSTGSESHAQVLLNGLVMVEAWIDSTYEFGFQNTVIVEVPLTNDTFDFELVATVDGTGNVKSHAKLELIGSKY